MTTDQLNIDVLLDPTDLRAGLGADACAGLTATPKTLPPKYFYDATGRDLFEQVTRLSECCPTRTEHALLSRRRREPERAQRRGCRAHPRLPGPRRAASRRRLDRHLDALPAPGTRLVAFLGSTLGNFPPAARAWDAQHEWIEMRLRATRAMIIRLHALDLLVTFAEGEGMRTEISAKLRPAGMRLELAVAGFDLEEWWTDPAGDYALVLARRTEDRS